MRHPVRRNRYGWLVVRRLARPPGPDSRPRTPRFMVFPGRCCSGGGSLGLVGSGRGRPVVRSRQRDALRSSRCAVTRPRFSQTGRGLGSRCASTARPRGPSDPRRYRALSPIPFTLGSRLRPPHATEPSALGGKATMVGSRHRTTRSAWVKDRRSGSSSALSAASCISPRTAKWAIIRP